MRRISAPALTVLCLAAAPALAQDNECPSGNPANCHPAFEGCGPSAFHTMQLAGETPTGQLELANNATTLHASLTAPVGWFFTRVYLHAGNGPLPSSPSAYGINRVVNPARASLEVEVPMFDGCGQVAVYAEMARLNFFGGVSRVGTLSLTAPVTYCSSCGGCSVAPGNFRTYGAGAWSSQAVDHPAAIYLNANFDAAFPGDLWIGGRNAIGATCANAARAVASSSGPARSLWRTYVDPAPLPNALAAQAIALALNINFDAADPDFATSSFAFGDLLITQGPYAGMRVQDFGENIVAPALGRNSGVDTPCATIDGIMATLIAINENFVDGGSGTALCCPAH